MAGSDNFNPGIPGNYKDISGSSTKITMEVVDELKTKANQLIDFINFGSDRFLKYTGSTGSTRDFGAVLSEVYRKVNTVNSLIGCAANQSGYFTTNKSNQYSPDNASQYSGATRCKSEW